MEVLLYLHLSYEIFNTLLISLLGNFQHFLKAPNYYTKEEPSIEQIELFHELRYKMGELYIVADMIIENELFVRESYR